MFFSLLLLILAVHHHSKLGYEFIIYIDNPTLLWRINVCIRNGNFLVLITL